MKKRLLAVLLTGCMLFQSTSSIAAAEIIEQDTEIIIQEEPTGETINDNPHTHGYTTGNESQDISLYDTAKEHVSASPPLNDSEINWGTPIGDDYWNSIDWSQINWQALSGFVTYSFPNGWATKVKWSEVNWKNVDWGDAYTQQKDAWDAIPWEKVNWDKMYWSNVNWDVLKTFVTADKINLTFTYNNVQNKQLTTPVTPNNGSYTIMSNNVTIKIKGSNAAGDAYKAIPYNEYTITVIPDGDNYKLGGIQNILGDDSRYDSADFFTLDTDPPTIINGSVTPSLERDDYWEITIDDNDCTFANTRSPLPKVTINSKVGDIELAENTDYTIEDITPDPAKLLCGEHQLKITATDTDKVSSSTVKKAFTVHYANIKDFYNLEGIRTAITVKDKVPNLTSESNRGSKTREELAHSLYLQPKDNDMLSQGQLPSVTGTTYGSELFNSNGFLKVEYRYDNTTTGEPVWSDTFDWNVWFTEHTTDILHIKVSVNETLETKYPQSTTGPVIYRYIKGSIYGSIRVSPYSLEEIYPEKEPKTAPTSDGYRTCYIAAVNPKPKNFDNIPTNAFESIGENPIDSVTYNGMKQTPTFICSVYKYSSIEVLIGGYPTDSTKYGYWEYNQNDGQFGITITYENNTNAGTGIARISFDGVFAGSITREFKIQEKDIADTSVSVQAQDFLYDGKPHAPILSISDSQANTVLREGIDYTVTPSGNITSPGTVTATITGINNYTGTRTVQYKIVSTSVIVPGTKLEQVADIPEKIADQRYTGQPVTPEVALTGKSSGMKLVKDKDYKVSYLNNIGPGTAYAVVEGIGSYGGTYIIPFNISGADISNATVTVNGTYTYTGKAIIPSVTVKMGDKVIDPADYEVAATDNINAGTGKFTVTGRNNCTGITGESTFKIKKANQKLSITNAQAKALLIRNTNANIYNVKVIGAKTKLSYKVSNKKIATVDSSGKLSFKHICGKAFVTAAAPASANYNAATLKIDFAVKPATPKIKVTPLNRGFNIEATSIRDITGYQVGYSTSSSFAASKTVKKRFDTTKALDKNITGLSTKKIYYVRVRAYKIASNGTRYWGNWTKGQKITTK